MTFVLADSATMLRRNLLHARRYPSLTISGLLLPLIFLLLFNYVFGRTLGDGLAAGNNDVTSATRPYIDYLTPGIVLMAALSGAVSTAISLSMDVTEGIVDRFRSMAISRTAFLTGHVLGNVLQTMAAVVLVTVVALAIGFRPDAGPVEWLAAFALLTLLVLAFTWLAAAMGLIAPNPESASNLPLPLTFLPLLGSAIVPTDSMPTGLRWFAEYQPFTPLTETLRGLLLGTPIGTSAWTATAWCIAIATGGYAWSVTAYRRRATT
ncbi:ABC transporter permease [Cryptosporangium sp. NPDC051539]|uniref:ABC transporter permease n=1 Tax=Cryptosporangium sp. NPDC051539 TaxID=3363962 RepID=UPI0037B17411